MAKKKRTVATTKEVRDFLTKAIKDAKDSGSILDQKEILFNKQLTDFEYTIGRAKLVLDDIEKFVMDYGVMAKSGIYEKFINDMPPSIRRIRIYADILRPMLKPVMVDNPNIFLDDEELKNIIENEKNYEERSSAGVVTPQLQDNRYSTLFSLTPDCLKLENLKNPEVQDYRRIVGTGVAVGVSIVAYARPQLRSMRSYLDGIFHGPFGNRSSSDAPPDYRIPSSDLAALGFIVSKIGNKESIEKIRSTPMSVLAVRLHLNRVVSQGDKITEMMMECHRFMCRLLDLLKLYYNTAVQGYEEFVKNGVAYE